MVVTDKTNLYPHVLFVQVLLVCHCVNSTPSTARSTHSDLCGPSDVVLHSETLLTFPVSVDHSLLNLLLRSPPSYPLEIKHVADATHKVNGVTSDAVYYNCTWVVRADQGCAVSAIIDFDNVNGYDFSVADHVDVIKNCSSKHCTFHSTTPVVSIRFRTKRVDSAPAARFVARLYSTRPPNMVAEYLLLTQTGYAIC
ncbi:hypothetical protein AB6A40_007836 [Gnathostoma spinigerum]|uniref:CUB domain-containing protein n=1 Tax=Gnathostoma spinigerum TaxID=75299 RepID=A0ABD6EX33_9BILA